MDRYSEWVESFLHDTAWKKETPIERKATETPPPMEKPYSPDAEIIRLTEPGLLDDVPVNFLEIVELRASVRRYRDEPLTMKELSFLLWCTQGVKMKTPQGTTLRNVPSAGARHALETYLLIQRVEGLTPGLYRFLALEHALLPIETGEEALEKFFPCFIGPGMIRGSAVTFLWVADFRRMTFRYGRHSARFIFLDAGHVCQNLYLAAQTAGIGVCAVGAFYDDDLNAALHFNGYDDFVVYSATVGKPLR